MPAGSLEGVRRMRQRAGRVGDMAVLRSAVLCSVEVVGGDVLCSDEGGEANAIVLLRDSSVASTVVGGSFS